MKQAAFRILLVLRVLLGCVFLFSAIAKLVSIDRFELYVYSFGFIPLNAAFVLTRLCIAGEMLLGFGLVSNLYGRLVNAVTQIVLVLFCVFLCYAALIGRDDNCQCFGSLVEFNPVQSIVKNAVLFMWSLFVSRVPSFRWRPCWYLWGTLIGLCVMTPFLISPLDQWAYRDDDRAIPYDQTLLKEHLASDSLFVCNRCHVGNKIMVFMSPRCPWCQMCVEKLQTMRRKFELPDTAFVYVIPQPRVPVEMDYQPIIIPRELISRLTYGHRPIVVFVQNGLPRQSRHYRALDEDEIRDFVFLGR